VDLYIHSPIRLHGVVLNWLSRGTTLRYLMGHESWSVHRTLVVVYYISTVYFRFIEVISAGEEK
jgi:hypothetical protein